MAESHASKMPLVFSKIVAPIAIGATPRRKAIISFEKPTMKT